jgi:hypothetical protein
MAQHQNLEPETLRCSFFLSVVVVVVEFEVKERTIGTRRNLFVRPNGYTRFFFFARSYGPVTSIGFRLVRAKARKKDTDVLHWRSSDIVSLCACV